MKLLFRGRMEGMGKYRKLRTVDKERLLRLYFDEKLSIQTLAIRFGISLVRIRSWVKEEKERRRNEGY